jgi:hypothetical protein
MRGSIVLSCSCESEYGITEEIGYSRVGDIPLEQRILYKNALLYAKFSHLNKKLGKNVIGDYNVEREESVKIKVHSMKIQYYTGKKGKMKKQLKKTSLTTYEKKVLKSEVENKKEVSKKSYKSMYGKNKKPILRNLNRIQLIDRIQYLENQLRKEKQKKKL